MHRSVLIAALVASACPAPPAFADLVTHVPLYTFHGDSSGDAFGFSVSGAGDVNGDGFADLIVGAPVDDNNGSNSGSARVLSGLDGSALHEFNGDSVGEEFGTSVSGAGDVNGDGRADLIVGARLDDNNGLSSGSARVLSGLDGGELFEFDGDSAGDEFGFSVSGAGDVNGDGFADLIVGAFDDDNNGKDSGSARVLSGLDGGELYEFNGDSADDRFGVSVSDAGDVNGDGFADLVVGAFDDDNNGTDSGSARVLSGSDGSELFEFNGDSANDDFGGSVSGAGDVNGDGIADLIVGADRDDNNGANSGSARVLSGLDGSALHEFNGDSVGEEFGTSVSGAGDVNGDGRADLIVGARLDDNNGSFSGSARVLSGFDGSTLYTFDSDSAGDEFGISVSDAGDVNGDGFADFIVGADWGGLNDGGYARVFVSSLNLPNGDLVIGDQITHTVNLTNGQTIEAGHLYMARQATGDATLNIDGAGTLVRTTDDALLGMADATTPGGTAALNLTNRGALEVGGEYVGDRFDPDNGPVLANPVNDATLYAGPDATIDLTGVNRNPGGRSYIYTGNLDLNGSQVTLGEYANLLVGTTVALAPAFGNNTPPADQAQFFIGDDEGNGNAVLRNGAVVTLDLSDPVIKGLVTIGTLNSGLDGGTSLADGSGTLTVTGTGSRLRATGDDYDLWLIPSSAGTEARLEILDGGSVVHINGLSDQEPAGAQGQATVHIDGGALRANIIDLTGVDAPGGDPNLLLEGGGNIGITGNGRFALGGDNTNTAAVIRGDDGQGNPSVLYTIRPFELRGDATMTVEQGGRLEARGHVSLGNAFSGTQATLLFDGPDTTGVLGDNPGDQISVGRSGSGGRLEIRNGADVQSQGLFMVGRGSDGEVVIDGGGSQLVHTGAFYTRHATDGTAADAHIEVTNGGLLDITGTMRLGDEPQGNTTVDVGSGSMLDISDDLIIGGAPTATATLSLNGAVVSGLSGPNLATANVGGNVHVGQEAGSAGLLLDGAASMDIEGDLIVGGQTGHGIVSLFGTIDTTSLGNINNLHSVLTVNGDAFFGQDQNQVNGGTAELSLNRVSVLRVGTDEPVPTTSLEQVALSIGGNRSVHAAATDITLATKMFFADAHVSIGCDGAGNGSLQLTDGSTLQRTGDGLIRVDVGDGDAGGVWHILDQSSAVVDRLDVDRSGESAAGSVRVDDSALLVRDQATFIGANSTLDVVDDGRMAIGSQSLTEFVFGDAFGLAVAAGSGSAGEQLPIEDGAVVNVEGEIYVGANEGESASLHLRGTGTSITNDEHFYVGQFGGGEVLLEEGARLKASDLTVGKGSPGNGSATFDVRGPGAMVELVDEDPSSLTVAFGGAMSVTDGADASTDVFVADGDASMLISGQGSVVRTTDLVTISGSVDFGTDTVFTVANGGLLESPVGIELHPRATLRLLGGTVRTGGLDRPFNDGDFDFVSGRFELIGDDFDVDTELLDSILGGAGMPVIGMGRTLGIDQVATLYTPLRLGGGTLSVGELRNAALLDWDAGTVEIVGNQGVTVGGGGLFGQTLALGGDAGLAVAETLNVEAGGRVELNGGVVSGGQVDIVGVLRGEGRVDGPVSLLAGGELRSAAGQRLWLTGPVSNLGRIENLGGEIEFDGVVTNDTAGSIVGENATYRFDAGLTHAGAMDLSFGTSRVFGAVNNTGRINVAGGSEATFYDDVVNNGQITIAQAGTRTSAAVFFGTLSGGGTINGGGDLFILGGFNPGTSPGHVVLQADTVFGRDSYTLIEIAGNTPGVDYDLVEILGDVTLGGTLEIAFLNGFSPRLGDQFDFLDWTGTATGMFDELTFSGLPAGSTFDVSRISRNGYIPLVPEPTTAVTLTLVLGCLLRRQRYRSAFPR